jgi:hypothetical protein
VSKSRSLILVQQALQQDANRQSSPNPITWEDLRNWRQHIQEIQFDLPLPSSYIYQTIPHPSTPTSLHPHSQEARTDWIRTVFEMRKHKDKNLVTHNHLKGGDEEFEVLETREKIIHWKERKRHVECRELNFGCWQNIYHTPVEGRKLRSCVIIKK